MMFEEKIINVLKKIEGIFKGYILTGSLAVYFYVKRVSKCLAKEFFKKLTKMPSKKREDKVYILARGFEGILFDYYPISSPFSDIDILIDKREINQRKLYNLTLEIYDTLPIPLEIIPLKGYRMPKELEEILMSNGDTIRMISPKRLLEIYRTMLGSILSFNMGKNKRKAKLSLYFLYRALRMEGRAKEMEYSVKFVLKNF